ncbi:OmpA family protein [Spirosoma endbachense]|uniref:OmpA family protein n=1 Tax=Spirosoma endbachense TaxID=2666025 RepID=A0A6P1VT34_9BACT|nr:OmpA family protein [Spirosoma endbachense]QHV96243.1 OmpA family protein [Spirosoma endbachense]
MRALLILFVHLAIATVGYSQQQKTPVKQQKTLFTINAIDGKTSEELPARFTIHAKRAKRKFDGQSQLGHPYAFVLTGSDTLTVITKTPGYYESEEVMVISCDTCPNYGYAVRLDKEDPKADSIFRDLQVNQAFRLDNVYFDQGSYVPKSESYPQLNKLVKTLITTPKLVIEIAGHTDNGGDRRLNVLLSENRAKVIRSYLARKGIAESRLRANGYGDTRPAAPNDSEENKRQNRRVEFVVLAL